MIGAGRESEHENNLFFACSVIEVIGRNTKNRRGEVVKKLGKEEILKLVELADVLHCEPIDATANRLIAKHAIACGSYDNIAKCKYTVPTHFDIAKVYKRLIVNVSEFQNLPVEEAIIKVYSSWICEKIDNYNSSMYYENPGYLFESYKAGKVLS